MEAALEQDLTAPAARPSTDAASDAPADAPVGRKCEQLIAGARAVILAKGFEGASVDDIAREAGISKATMYRYFPDKSALFAAVMQRDCCANAQLVCGIVVEDRALRDVLIDLAGRYLAFILSDDAIQVFRTIVAETGRFPAVGRSFYAAGPERGQEWLAPILAAAAAGGEVALDDASAAANDFFALCRGDAFFRRLLGVDGPCRPPARDALAAAAVDAFLKLHRPD